MGLFTLYRSRAYGGMPIPTGTSWVMRKLLNLRGVCNPLITYVFGDNKGTFLVDRQLASPGGPFMLNMEIGFNLI